MATKRHHSPINTRLNTRQDEAQRCRRNMQRLLGSLAAYLPAQQKTFQSAFLMEFHRAAQTNILKQHKGAH